MLRVCWLLVLVPIGVGTAAQEGRPDRLQASLSLIDTSTAHDLVKVGREALRRGQRAAARRALRRALALSPGHPAARANLGYEASGEAWRRTSIEAARWSAAEDTDPDAASRLAVRLRRIEHRRADRILAVAKRAGPTEAARKALEAPLDFTPRHVGIHRALGHERIGNDFVRPEFVPIVRRRKAAVAAWRACAEPRDPGRPDREVSAPPGVRRWMNFFRCEGRLVGATFPAEEVSELARAMGGPHRLLGHLFGSRWPTWDPQVVHFLDAEGFRQLVHEQHESEAERKRRLRRSRYVGPTFVALRVDDLRGARDYYTHAVGSWSIGPWCAPLLPGGERGVRDWECYAWFKEGMAFLLTLELHDSADTVFCSFWESSGKADSDDAPPEPRNRAQCLAWLRRRLLDRDAPPLTEVLGRSLNELDLLASLEAWSFIRFLVLLDPEAFRRLPVCMVRRSKGSHFERSGRALRLAYGQGVDELATAWRRFTLEIE